MKKPAVIFGLRDFPGPRGEGFLFCKFAPHYREKILIEYDLYTDPGNLPDIYRKGIRKFFELVRVAGLGKSELLSDYDTVNMQPHARVILDKVLQEG